MNRLAAGAPAPTLTVTTLDGQHVRIPEKGRWTLLCFLRYASCPMCNLRVRELSRSATELESAGISWLAVFHSPEKRLEKHLPPATWSHVIPDNERRLSLQYRTRRSWAGMLFSVFVPSFYWRFAQTLRHGYWGGAVDHAFHSMPADFVVSPDGVIQLAHYGRHIGDHVSVAQVLHAVREGKDNERKSREGTLGLVTTAPVSTRT